MNTIREKEEASCFNAGVALGILGSSVIWFAIDVLVMLNAGKRYNNLQAEAVKHGAAEWVASEYGSVVFTWKETE